MVDVDILSISCKIALRWILIDLTDKSVFVEVMACAIKQQAITWTNVDPMLWCSMSSVGHNELSSFEGSRVVDEFTTYPWSWEIAAKI